MGVIKPPWVLEKWFNQTPFNYCDHFGDKEVLASICKICREENERLEKYKKEGKDPYDMKNVFEDVGKDLTLAMAMITKKAKEMGIDLDNIPDEVDDEPPHGSYPVFNTIGKYGDKIEKEIKELEIIPVEADMQLVMKAVDAFSHSRHYIIAKIARALSSRWEEAKDPDDDLDDSKTSAFLAYVAIERNSRAFLALSRHKPLKDMRVKHLRHAKLSLNLCELIKEEFFPNEKLEYEEYGYHDF